MVKKQIEIFEKKLPFLCPIENSAVKESGLTISNKCSRKYVIFLNRNREYGILIS